MQSHKVQKALAALITNPLYALNFEKFKHELRLKLELSEQEMEELSNFYAINNDKFTASSKILSKNRWDNIKQSLPLMCKYISNDSLDTIWHQYLFANNLDLLTPKNPLMESLVFGKFALQHQDLTLQEKEIVKYEHIRNKVTFAHHEQFGVVVPSKVKLVDDLNLLWHCLYIEGSYQIHQFEYDLLALMHKQEIIKASNKILFFKNLTKDGIGSLKLNDKVSLIIDLAINNKSLYDVMNSLSISSNEIFIGLIKQLIDCGVFYITTMNKVQ